MINIIPSRQNFIWDQIVQSFPNHDVYYLNGYIRAFEVNGDGSGYLLYYTADDIRAIYVFMLRKTDTAGVFDSITPYGYGGVLFDHTPDTHQLEIFQDEYFREMKQMHIVDNFVRYHPILKNALPMKEISCVVDLGHTIAMVLNDKERIWENITSKNRNMIRKAEKNGVQIHHGHTHELFDSFIEIYNTTMQRDNAESYYFFPRSFYESIHQDLMGHYEMFYAVYKGKIVAMSIMLYANRQMHYHLSGSLPEYRNLAPTNLLLYEAALWGHEQGFDTLHMGGGIGSREDNLYKFKAAFNRNAEYRFSIGKEIFDEDKYKELIQYRIHHDPDFNQDTQYFPAYRG